MSHRVILLEFNELTPTLLDRFLAEGQLQNFKRFYDESAIYVTDAEASGKLLNPWVQWVTVHTGLAADEHGLTELDEGHLLEQPRVWDLASRAGRKVFVCGSMNVSHDPDLNGFVIPDPWSTSVKPYPERYGFEDFYRFVQTQVQEHTNESTTFDSTDYARFLKFMLAHGMSAHTVSSIVKQLASERVAGGGRWKRAVILDKLQFDVFRAIFKKHRPDFSTFFLNSTAHLQHAYWRNMNPEPFHLKPNPEEQSEYEGAVLYGYKEMDKILGRVMDLAGEDVTVVLATALGQQPYLTLEESGGKHFYRPREFSALTSFAGISAHHECRPVMSEQFRIHFETEEDASAAVAILKALTIDERPVMEVRKDGERSVFAGCTIFDVIPPDAILNNGRGEKASFFELFYAAATIKSGMHHPDGALWVRTPERSHSVSRQRVSLRAVAPTLMTLLGLEPAQFMTAAPLLPAGEALPR